jgi:membrane protease YdiL (CAAX protease family)
MLTPFDHELALALAIIFPLRAYFGSMRRLQAADDADLPRLRIAAYRMAMIVQWVLAGTALTIWALTRRDWRFLGVIPVMSGGMIGVLIGLALIIFVVIRQGASAPDERSTAALMKRTQKIARLFPRSARELGWFFALSATAGVCEELLYRGYLIWYLQALDLPLLFAAAIATVLFGIGHLYQGWRGVVTTTLVGAFLAGVYLLSGSLFPGIVIHALMDAYSGWLLYRVTTAGAAADPAADAPMVIPA